jgi:hypothetical protein
MHWARFSMDCSCRARRDENDWFEFFYMKNSIHMSNFAKVRPVPLRYHKLAFIYPLLLLFYQAGPNNYLKLRIIRYRTVFATFN